MCSVWGWLCLSRDIGRSTAGKCRFRIAKADLIFSSIKCFCSYQNLTFLSHIQLWEAFVEWTLVMTKTRVQFCKHIPACILLTKPDMLVKNKSRFVWFWKSCRKCYSWVYCIPYYLLSYDCKSYGWIYIFKTEYFLNLLETCLLKLYFMCFLIFSATTCLPLFSQLISYY